MAGDKWKIEVDGPEEAFDWNNNNVSISLVPPRTRMIITEEKRYYSINAIMRHWHQWISHCDCIEAWDDAFGYLSDMLEEFERTGVYKDRLLGFQYYLRNEELNPEEW